MPIKTEHRITALESNYQSLNDKVDEIKDNHLAHLDAKVDKVQEKLDRGQWLVITTLVSVIVTLGLLLWK